MIIGAFFTQRPSLMGEREWMVATKHHGPDGSPLFPPQTSFAVSDLDFLMDILAELPALFLKCNECIRLATTSSLPLPSAHFTTIWTRVRQLQRELQAWKERWDDNHQSEIHETLPTAKVQSTQIMAWETVFNFNSVELAVTFTMYHSVVILLTSIPTSLVQIGLFSPPFSISSISDYHVSDLSQSLRSEVETSVCCICRSIEYHIRSLHPSQALADFYLFFPVHVARRASIQLGHSSKISWLADAFDVMKSKYPMGVWANMDFANRFSGHEEGLFG